MEDVQVASDARRFAECFVKWFSKTYKWAAPKWRILYVFSKEGWTRVNRLAVNAVSSNPYEYKGHAPAPLNTAAMAVSRPFHSQKFSKLPGEEKARLLQAHPLNFVKLVEECFGDDADYAVFIYLPSLFEPATSIKEADFLVKHAIVHELIHCFEHKAQRFVISSEAPLFVHQILESFIHENPKQKAPFKMIVDYKKRRGEG